MVYTQKCWVFWMCFQAFIVEKWCLMDKYSKFQAVPAISLDVLLYQSISHLSNLSAITAHNISQPRWPFQLNPEQFHVAQRLRKLQNTTKFAAFFSWYESGGNMKVVIILYERWCDVDTWRLIHYSRFSDEKLYPVW